jgi:ATP-dependent DNA helicase RecQ
VESATQSPTWVTCVPSLRHPDLVPNFAQRLAAALGLPFHMVIAKTDARPEQKTMANSTQQARNIDGSLALNGQPFLPARSSWWMTWSTRAGR